MRNLYLAGASGCVLACGTLVTGWKWYTISLWALWGTLTIIGAYQDYKAKQNA